MDYKEVSSTITIQDSEIRIANMVEQLAKAWSIEGPFFKSIKKNRKQEMKSFERSLDKMMKGSE